MAAQPKTAVSRQAVTNYLLLGQPNAKQVTEAGKFYAVLDGEEVRGQKPPFIALNWADCAAATQGYKPRQEFLALKNGVYFKSFKTLIEAVDWTVGRYVPSVRDQLLRHIAQQQQ